uniref:Protein EARLY FLOWERING 3 n=1 Tax=Brassica oleracea TaxID=3712 RepID=A0A3P6GHF9_BRAOL|nr:unnamed protein product [Brassica oleracea]
MKRGKEEEKRLEPMFPRLHVKDAEKGGPRAPPRNKMALYEQLSIPSQRFTSSDRAGSLPRNTSSPLLPPGPSSNQGTDNFVSHMPFMENVRASSAHHDHQRKIAREEDDFAVPVFINSRCSGRGKCGSKRGVGLAANSATEEMDLASASDRVDDGRINNGVESHMAASEEEGHGHGHGNANDEYCTSGGGYTSLQQEINNEEEASDDNSMVDSVSSLDVSPDDVVGVLGQKRFWRARKAIANQQRVFAVQLFELHRLIKVQRLIAASPDVLVDDMSYVGKVTAKSYPVKQLHLPSGFIVKPPLPQVIKHRNSSDSDKTDQHKMECSAENVVGKLPNQGQGQGQVHHHHQPSNYMMPFATNQPSPNGCYYPPQPPPSGGNQQWLIPVMSPSEGLIYKPHPGPDPGHTGPVCGGYYGHFMPAPMFMGGGGGQPPPFHPGMGFPSHGNGYFPPYGGIMMNPYYSGRQQQQQPNEQMNNNIQQQSSVNEATSQQQQPTKSYPRAKKSRQEGISGKKKSFQPFSAVDDVHDDKINNAAQPTEEMMTTTTTTTTTVTQTTRDGAGVTRVIKVVPHNANLASENAARIFRSIQEERKHYYP